MSVGRYGRVDSIRGLAALTVAIFHSIHLFPLNGIDKIYALKLLDIPDVQVGLARILLGLFNGNAAVSLFFVISGFVLWQSTQRSHHPSWRLAVIFLSKRLIRLYPPMAVALTALFAIGMVCHLLAPNLFQLPSFKGLLENLGYVSVDFMGATWSLFVEIGVAPAFVLVAILSRSFGQFLLYAAITFAVAILFTGGRSWHSGPWPQLSLSHSYFLFLFGAMLPVLKPAVERISPKRAVALLATAFLVLGFARGIFGYHSKWSLLFEGLSAATIIAVVAYGPDHGVVRWLDNRLARSLGHVSYSLYLYHPLALAVMVPIIFAAGARAAPLAPVTSGIVLAMLTIPPALVAAVLSYKFIEEPTIKFCGSMDGLFTRRNRLAVEHSN